MVITKQAYQSNRFTTKFAKEPTKTAIIMGGIIL